MKERRFNRVHADFILMDGNRFASCYSDVCCLYIQESSDNYEMKANAFHGLHRFCLSETVLINYVIYVCCSGNFAVIMYIVIPMSS